MLISLYLFYQLNPQISILSPQPMPFQSCQLNPTVLQPWKCSHFAQKQKIRELRVRPKLSEIPLFQGFFTYYFSTLDRVEQWGFHRPLIKPYMRFSRIRLSDILLPSAFSRKYLPVLPLRYCI